ncbi:ArsR family transcriptional regulator [Thalassococcus profundi]|uniref:ArsR family transcriptional regulator n=1 Tax=Thalassococcus profundi TaxID=2282382 RepID=A0A369TPA5_9RHOB|nr:metalloregulator ArsR/SmtB family transcription factor [Thalassococcus profundi]RDD66682.1 ArsR family transcriptional regulator [Thalassococcus profundi]
MEIEPTYLFATLGHPQRLAIFRLLMRRYPDRLAAGEIAQVLDLRASTLSVYLSALREAGLIRQQRQGTSLLYSADVEAAGDLLTYVLADCCRNRPAQCLPGLLHAPGEHPVTNRKYRVLFICTGNSARSIFAETLLRDLAGDRFEACSAGTQPRSELNPQAVALLEAKGHDVSGLRAKHVSEFQGEGAPVLDFVFTVCDRAANEDCPPWPGQPISAHWGQPDPVKATGTEAERKLAFQQAYGALRNRIALFTALPLDSLDRLSLQARVDEIAHLKEESA